MVDWKKINNTFVWKIKVFPLQSFLELYRERIFFILFFNNLFEHKNRLEIEREN